MMDIDVLEIDLEKNVFQLHGTYATVVRFLRTPCLHSVD
jgi:hypothetical protein